MIEELNKVLENKDIYLSKYKAGINEWRIYDKANDTPLGNLYISSKGNYEFNLVKNFKDKNEVKKEIARVISKYDDYDNSTQYNRK